MKPGDPRREGRGDGDGTGREGGADGWEGGIDVMPLMKWVHRHSMAWKGCRIGNPSEARYNQLVNQYFISTRLFFRLVKAMVADDQIN